MAGDLLDHRGVRGRRRRAGRRGTVAGSGFIQQEDIPFDDLLSTSNGAVFGNLGKV